MRHSMSECGVRDQFKKIDDKVDVRKQSSTVASRHFSRRHCTFEPNVPISSIMKSWYTLFNLGSHVGRI